MKKRVLSMLLVSILLITQVTVLAKDYSDYPQRFWDVPKDYWAFEYISELVDKNVLAGYEDGSYRPEETVTRAEWSKMMVVASGKQEVKLNNNGSYAVDYNSNDWYYGYINAVVDYMNFYNESDGTYFKPNQAVSREDVTVSLVKLKGYDTDNVDYSVVMKFKDNASISNSIKKYVAVGIEKGLISGYEDNTFRGQDTLTRAEAATLLCRAFQMGNDNKTNNNPDVVNPDENNNSNSNTSNDTQNDVNNNGNGNTNVSNNDENKEDKKEYKVETISENVNLKEKLYGYSQFVTVVMTSNEDIIYYYDKESKDFYSLDMNTLEVNNLINYDEVIINKDGEEYKLSEMNQFFYDNKSDTLIVKGGFKSNKSFQASKWLYDVSVSIPNCEIIDDGKTLKRNSNVSILGTLNDGTYIQQLADREDALDITEGFGNSIVYRDYVETDDGIYLFSGVGTPYSQQYGLSLYNYIDNVEIAMYPIKNVDGYCLKENYFYLAGNNTISKFDYDTNEINSFMANDIEIKDRKSFSTENMYEKFFVSSNDDIVFYDMTNKCFRMISKND